jgi:putative restriction endonuclease
MVYGTVNGIDVGDQFSTYEELRLKGLHRSSQSGIAGYGQAPKAAESIVLSDGYRDDFISPDFQYIHYTGMGGQHPSTKKQIKDQTLTRGNQALVINYREDIAVRVIHRVKRKSPYKYLGLYRVENYDYVISHDGPYVYSFYLTRLEQVPSSSFIDSEGNSEDAENFQGGSEFPGRKEGRYRRIIRSPKVAAEVKKIYSYRCQVCSTKLESPAGPYAEAAHIQPLGGLHNGPDILANILCLCANCHVLFDLHAFTIDENLRSTHTGIEIATHRSHNIGDNYLQLHRDEFERKRSKPSS